MDGPSAVPESGSRRVGRGDAKTGGGDESQGEPEREDAVGLWWARQSAGQSGGQGGTGRRTNMTVLIR